MVNNNKIYYIFVCPQCGLIKGYKNLDEIHICKICKTIMVKSDVGKTIDEWTAMAGDVSENQALYQEYQNIHSTIREQYCLNSPQFDQAAWDRRVRIENGEEKMYEAPKPKNVPKCPTCGSTDLRKITTGNKVGSVLFWGIFAAGKVAKTWHCNNCGSEW